MSEVNYLRRLGSCGKFCVIETLTHRNYVITLWRSEVRTSYAERTSCFVREVYKVRSI